MNSRPLSGAGATFSLLLVLLGGCGQAGAPGKPALPASVSPGWAQKWFEHSAPPAGLPGDSKPDCWKAQYTGKGAADIWACAYAAPGSAFDAVQRTRAEAETVKFQEGRYLVIVKWSGGSKEEITALVRAVQRALTVK